MFMRLLDTVLPATVLLALVLAMATGFGMLSHAPVARVSQGEPAVAASSPARCATSAETGAGSCG